MGFPHTALFRPPFLSRLDANGEWLRFSIDFPGAKLWIRTWQVKVGRTKRAVNGVSQLHGQVSRRVFQALFSAVAGD